MTLTLKSHRKPFQRSFFCREIVLYLCIVNVLQKTTRNTPIIKELCLLTPCKEGEHTSGELWKHLSYRVLEMIASGLVLGDSGEYSRKGVCSRLDAVRKQGETATGGPERGRNGVKLKLRPGKAAAVTSSSQNGWLVGHSCGWTSSVLVSLLRHDYRAGLVLSSTCQGPARPCPMLWLDDVFTVGRRTPWPCWECQTSSRLPGAALLLLRINKTWSRSRKTRERGVAVGQGREDGGLQWGDGGVADGK